MKSVLKGLVLASSMLIWVGCSTMGDQPQAAKRSDTDIERTINDRIRENPSLVEAKLDVDADVDNQSVTLSGKVASQEQRTQAVEIAKNAEPGFTVNDKIDVMPKDVPLADYTEDMARTTRESAERTGEKIGATLEDAWIHTKVTAKLTVDGTTPAHKINVDVVNKVVTLRGDVESAAAKREAARIAGEIEGVTKVNNLLKVQS